MNKKRLLSHHIGMALIALLLVGCGAPAPAATPTSPPEPTPDAAALIPPTPIYYPQVGNLQNLESYSYTFSASWRGRSLEGETGTRSHTQEWQVQNRPARAQHSVWSVTFRGETSQLEWIYIEERGTAWWREPPGGEWQEMNLEQYAQITALGPLFVTEEDSTGAFAWLISTSPKDLQFVGEETINGILAYHFRADTVSYPEGAGCTVTQAEDNIWVAVEESFPVKQILDVLGTCNGESAEWHFTLDVTGVNQPVEITAPG